jgi:hypothetical protein
MRPTAQAQRASVRASVDLGTFGATAMLLRLPRQRQAQRLTAAEKDAWTAAAECDGRDLSGWLRYLANREVGDGRKGAR